MRVAAPAKVNLRLVVLAREAGGYHQIETIFCRIALADEIIIEHASNADVELQVLGADVGPAPDNLVMRAVHAYCKAAAVSPAFSVTVHKHVPAGAGLGGGSSDAAATLRALDAMHDERIGRERLLQLGLQLGSDVPFFLASAPLALAWGRGQRLLTLPGPGSAPALVAMPLTGVATGDAYARIDRLDDAAPAACIDAASLGSWSALAAIACNDFERIVLPDIPPLTDALSLLRGHGARIAQLTGSGAAIFAIFDAVDARDAAADALQLADVGLRLFPTVAGV